MEKHFSVKVFVVVFAPVFLLVWSDSLQAGEKLYNGIVLPEQWPPRAKNFTLVPMPVPYLKNPPEVIEIDVGRQLFVDDFLIEHTSLTRTHHLAKYWPDNPVLKPDRPWEMKFLPQVYGGGVWYDPQDKLFKLWYEAKITKLRKRTGAPYVYVAYATSRDGIDWEKPSLDIVPGTNIVLKCEDRTTGMSTMWLDLEETNPQRRFKMSIIPYSRAPYKIVSWMKLFFSPDGIHWTDSGAGKGMCLDRSTIFYNPFRKVWVFSLKWNLYDFDLGSDGVLEPQKKIGGKQRRIPGARLRGYREHADIVAGLQWKPARDHVTTDVAEFINYFLEDAAVRWTGADFLDPMRNVSTTLEGSTANFIKQPELYNLDAVAYESVLLGLFTIFHGNDDGTPASHYHMTDVSLGYSRDGFHWYRPDRRAFMGVGDQRTDWNWTVVQSSGGCCLVVGDKLYFYAIGRSPECNSTGLKKTFRRNSTGLAILRRDGFASMDADSEQGVLVTRPVRFSGKYLFVNIAAEAGELSVEVLDKGGQPIAPFSRDNCVAVSVDKTLQAVRWKDAKDLSALAGQPVRFRFYLTNGNLYSFWVSPDQSGASYGYVAAGGPGFTGPTDTVGSAE